MNKSRVKFAATVSFAITALAMQALFGVVYAAEKRMYYWSGYQHAISSTNNTPEKVNSSEAALRSLIKKSDEAGRRIAPGLLAEYGYFFFERGEFDTAVYWFEREIGEWPESSVLMKKMIERAREGSTS